jgi:CheY-like chemotaxis protein
MLRALCVGRHRFLADHVCSVFRDFGLETTPAVGTAGVLRAARERTFDLVICDYDLLAMVPLEAWERDGLLSRIPVVAVSLTRRHEEVHLLDVNGIAGFLYLPTLDRATALRVLAGCRPVSTPYSLPGPFAARESAAR